MAVVFALGAALCLALASVIQADAARGVAVSVGMLGLVKRLLRNPRWLVGRAIDTGALVLQAVALARGSFTLVQAALTLSVVFALTIEALLRQRKVRATELVGSLALVGVVLVVGVAHPSRGTDRLQVAAWSIGLLIVSLVVAAAVLCSRSGISRSRAAAVLAIGAGTCFAFDGAFLKAVHVVRSQSASALPQVVCVGGFLVAAGIGNVLIQRAFQIAPLNASLPTITATVPLVSAVIGALLFRERLARGAAAPLAALAGAVLLVAGAALAARPRPAPPTVPDAGAAATPGLPSA